MGRGGRPARVKNGPVVAYAEHVRGHCHGAASCAHVYGVRAGGDRIGRPAPHPARDRSAAAACGRRARHQGTAIGGRMAVRATRGRVCYRVGRVSRGAVRRRRVPVVRAQPVLLDVLRVLRVPVHRVGRHVHVRADRVEHRTPV